ncbi:MAG: hypothetical protein ACREFD_02835 [Stellaceae bacterium]
MPGDVFWELNATRATLVCGPLHASLDVLSPANGLSEVSHAGVALFGSHFLGVDLPVSDASLVAEFYHRGGDVIVRYGQTRERPFDVSAYWRAGLLVIGGIGWPRIDLVASVETSLLDARPSLAAQTRLNLGGDDAFAVSGGDILGRFRVPAVSYAEIRHPDDAIAASIESVGNRVLCTTRLFGGFLEKGVILRSRLRGLFLPRARDEQMARAALAEFAAAPPPLTS